MQALKHNCIRPGLHRQCLFGGLRIGLYEPVKRVYMGDRPPGDAPLYLKVAAGLTTGALAIAIASPTDLVKVLHRQHFCMKLQHDPLLSAKLQHAVLLHAA